MNDLLEENVKLKIQLQDIGKKEKQFWDSALAKHLKTNFGTNEESEMWENIGTLPKQNENRILTWEEIENIESNWKEIDKSK